jgi:hypothetical protein
MQLIAKMPLTDWWPGTFEPASQTLLDWLSYPVLPDKNLIVIPREDELMFGLLQSWFHEAWALRKGSDLEIDRDTLTHICHFSLSRRYDA